MGKILMALLKNLTAGVAADKNKRSKFLTLLGSIIVGTVLLLFAPLAVFISMGKTESPPVDVQFDESAFLSQLSPEQQENIAAVEADGQAIADAMAARGLQEQTIKAQLIYMSYFGENRLSDFAYYADLFYQSNEQLIQSLNDIYGLGINFDEFIRTYIFVITGTIYMAYAGTTLTEYTEEYITTRLAVIPEKVYKIEYYRKVYKCKNCDKNGIKANIMKAENKTPACIIKKGLPDASLVANIMQRKYQLGEPLYRQEQYWKLRGIYLNRTSLANWVIAGAAWFEPIIRRLRYHAMSEPVLNADETPTRVLKKDGKPTKKKGQMWIVCTGAAASKKIALYAYHDSRSKAVAEKLLRGYTGVVQTDGLQSYGTGEYAKAGCWAHFRRKFYDCIPEGDKICPSAQIVALIDKASAYEKAAKEKKYSFDDILEMRQSKVKPLLDKVYEIINTLRPSKGSALGTAITYALNQKEKLYLFLSKPKVEMTNNLAERTVKPYVINRKNFLFSDTENGAAASAAVMSIIETAKRNNLDVYGYLLYLLTVMPEWGKNSTNKQLDSVMPWSLTLPAYCRQMYSEIR